MPNANPEPLRPQATLSPLRAERIQSKLRAERIQQTLTRATKLSPLGPEDIQERLRALPGWRPGPGHASLERSYLFPSYTAATAFLALVSEIAEVTGAMPEARVRGMEVKLRVATAEGALTEIDFELAQLVDSHL
jgi:pterin-4a-carbinolamine dehydratase